MTHYLACFNDGAVTVASDVPADFVPTPPWVVVDADELEAMKANAAETAVPKSVTARQIRLWLVSHGIGLAAVEAAIDAIPEAMQRDMVRVEWEYAPYVERTHAMLVPLAAALGMSEAQVDQAFREAAAL